MQRFPVQVGFQAIEQKNPIKTLYEKCNVCDSTCGYHSQDK